MTLSSNSKVQKFIHVAVGVVVDETQRICITQRQPYQHLAGFWEFPGGKVEQGETTLAALKRELHEEINIRFDEAETLVQVKHAYPDKNVFLDVLLIKEFEGEAEGQEGQDLQWVQPAQLKTIHFPEANIPIVEALLTHFELNETLS